MQSITGILYLVGTPIGHLADLSPRAQEVLQSVDIIAAEDTRRTGQLLKHFGIHTPQLVSTHQHNEQASAQGLLKELQAGKNVALVSDSGMPTISDPGAAVVRQVRAAGLAVVPVSGPCAAVLALAASGLGGGAFTFVGFLPTQQKAQQHALQRYAAYPDPLIFYEAPHRLLATLQALQTTWGDRDACVARELTKMHEEIVAAPLSALHTLFTERGDIKGEITLVVAGAEQGDTTDWAALENEMDQRLQAGDSAKTIRDALAAETGLSKKELYQRVLARQALCG